MLIKTSEERYPIENSGRRRIPEEVLRAILSGEDPKYADFQRRLLAALGRQAGALRKFFAGLPGGDPNLSAGLVLDENLKGKALGRGTGPFLYADAADAGGVRKALADNYAKYRGIRRERPAEPHIDVGADPAAEHPRGEGRRLPKNWKLYAAGGGLAGLGALGAYLYNKGEE